MYKNIPEDRRPQLCAAGVNLVAGNGTGVRVWGQCDIKIKIEDMEFVHKFITCEDSVIPILGRDFMRKQSGRFGRWPESKELRHYQIRSGVAIKD